MEKQVKSALHLKDVQLFLDECTRTREPVRLFVLKADGTPATFDGWLVSSGNWRAGTHKLRHPRSGQVRQIADILIFGINGHPVYI